MISRFFIDRPVLGVVISVIIVLGGVAALKLLPIAQYPDITPPTVEVSCSFPGANAVVVAETIAANIEQEVNGVENMLYMSSQSTNDGGYKLTVTFKLGTNLDMAQVLVQNRVNLALPRLPDVVKTTGVSTKKKSPSVLLVVNMYSERDAATGQPLFDQLYLSNYATIQIRDELARLDGVGDVSFFGQQDYSLRAWLNPEQMASYGLTASDLVNVLKEQNVQVAAGRLGQPPVPAGQDFQYTLSTLGRLIEPDQFRQIVVKTGDSGQVVRLHDVARVELGAKNLDTQCMLDGQPSIGLPIFQLPGANALATADRVRAKMQELEKRFPPGVKFTIAYDTTPFIRQSVDEVFHTLRDAVILVAIVVLLFLQDWKAMILPMIDVPVSLIGTLGVMYMLGFTLNNLTLFGLVLAIGIVVDDAIVVLENVERWMATGLDSRTATIKAMEEITGAIIAITLVLCAVFIPSALIGGISGQFYRQFALTISASMVISALNAMTMTPSRAVLIFANRGAAGHAHGAHEALPWWGCAALAGWICIGVGYERAVASLGAAVRSTGLEWGVWVVLACAGALFGAWVAAPLNRLLGRFFAAFNRGFDRIAAVYGRIVARSLRLCVVVLIVFGGLLGLTWLGFTRIPTGFIPAQDKGYLVVDVQLPDSASLERTHAVINRVEQMARQAAGVAHTVAISGQSTVLNAVGSNLGSMFVILDDFGGRHGHALHASAIAAKLQQQFRREMLEAQVAVYGAPAVDGLGNAGGFKLMIQDRGDSGLDVLQGQSENLVEKGRRAPGIAGLFGSFRANTPQLFIDIDRTKCKTLHIPLDDAFNTLQVFLGGYYVNDFNRFGRTWQVNLQADAVYRLKAEDIRQLKVRSADGSMIPFGAIAAVRDVGGPSMITRYKMFTAAPINGAARPGVSSGTAIALMNQLTARELPDTMTSEWTELTLLQLEEGSSALLAFAGAVVLVFFVLAGQFESYAAPLAIMLVVPMCLLSSLAGLVVARLDINIFVQIGFIVLVGLAAKNAILIVEFAKQRQAAGKTPFDAAVDAAHSRLRPIIMTSFAFILGVLPLVLSHGAGAEMRFTLGVAVFSGMLGVTIFGIFLTPVFYYVVQRVSSARARA